MGRTIGREGIDGGAGLSRRKPMAKHRTYGIEFKRQVAQEFLAGETLHKLAKRHDVYRNLIRIWFRSTKLASSRMMRPPPSASAIRSPDRGA